MISVRCPICSTHLEISSIDDLPSFPFCSERCKMIDLGRWLNGEYFLPEKETSTSTGEEAIEEEDDG